LKRCSGKKRKAIILFPFILVTLILFLCFFEIRVRPIISSLALSNVKNLSVRIISGVVNDTMEKQKIKYSDLINFEKNEKGEISATTLNAIEVNKLKAKLIADIEKEISSIDTITVKIPLGNLLNQSMLSGVGPRIRIKIIPVGNVLIDINNNIITAGINQTKHEVYFEVKCSVSVLFAIWSETATVDSKILIAETVIIGNVPETFTNVEGQDTPEDAVLNLLPDGGK